MHKIHSQSFEIWWNKQKNRKYERPCIKHLNKGRVNTPFVSESQEHKLFWSVQLVKLSYLCHFVALWRKEPDVLLLWSSILVAIIKRFCCVWGRNTRNWTAARNVSTPLTRTRLTHSHTDDLHEYTWWLECSCSQCSRQTHISHLCHRHIVVCPLALLCRLLPWLLILPAY